MAELCAVTSEIVFDQGILYTHDIAMFGVIILSRMKSICNIREKHKKPCRNLSTELSASDRYQLLINFWPIV